jgi:hypothetical protein
MTYFGNIVMLAGALTIVLISSGSAAAGVVRGRLKVEPNHGHVGRDDVSRRGDAGDASQSLASGADVPAGHRGLRVGAPHRDQAEGG